MNKTGSHEMVRDDDALAVRLLGRIAREDRVAMDHFYGIHEAGIYRLALAILDDAQGANDVLVNVMLTVWRNAASLAAEGNVRTALLDVVVREARAWAATHGKTDFLTGDADPDLKTLDAEALERRLRAPIDHTPGDFGLDQIWLALDAERREQRRIQRRRRVLRLVVSVKRTIVELMAARRAA